MNKKLLLSFLFFLAVCKNIVCSQDFKRGFEVGAVSISLLASALEAHSNYSSNSSFHKTFGKNYSGRKVVADTYVPIIVAATQLATLACSKSSNGNNCAVLNCIISALNIWRISYGNFVQRSNHQDFLVRSITNQRAAAKVVDDYERLAQRQQNTIQSSRVRVAQAQGLVRDSLEITRVLQQPVVGVEVVPDNHEQVARRLTILPSQETLQS